MPKKCLSSAGGQESLNVSLKLEESVKSSKRSDRTMFRLFLADRKLTSKELARKVKDRKGAE